MSVKILSDLYVKYLDKLLPEQVEYSVFDPAHGLPENAIHFDALLVRTVTPINPLTLPNAGNIKFVGTATAGIDHIDQSHLQNLGIEFSQSEGCNANAVAEYIITVLYRWAEKTSADLSQKTVGVVGCGHTGAGVIRLLEKLGVSYIAFDPPKSEREPGFASATEEELMHSDVLTFHTPLTFTGKHPTKHIGSDSWFQKGFDLVINASRGGVVDESALFEHHSRQNIQSYILDVWENEPDFNNTIARDAFIATPHIAGYSIESKFMATKIVLSRMLQHFGLDVNPDAKPDLFPLKDFNRCENCSIGKLLWQNNRIHYYDSELRKLIGIPSNEKRARFAELRSKTALRHEYRAMIEQAKLTESVPEPFQVFRKDSPQ